MIDDAQKYTETATFLVFYDVGEQVWSPFVTLTFTQLVLMTDLQ